MSEGKLPQKLFLGYILVATMVNTSFENRCNFFEIQGFLGPGIKWNVKRFKKGLIRLALTDLQELQEKALVKIYVVETKVYIS